MRVSDEDRERGTRKLQEAFMEGRLTQLELEDRLELALTARTYGDLLGLIADLPADEPPVDEVVEDGRYIVVAFFKLFFPNLFFSTWNPETHECK